MLFNHEQSGYVLDRSIKKADRSVSCITLLLWQTDTSFVWMSSDPANKTQVSKAITISVFVFVCLFFYYFKKGRLRPLLTTEVNLRFIALRKKLFVQIIGHWWKALGICDPISFNPGQLFPAEFSTSCIYLCSCLVSFTRFYALPKVNVSTVHSISGLWKKLPPNLYERTTPRG